MRIVAVALVMLLALASKAPAEATEPGTRFRDCPDCPEMVWLPPGEFTMGSPPGEPDRWDDEGPQRTVQIAYPMAVGVHEVTRSAFAAFVAATGHTTGTSCWVARGPHPLDMPGVSWRDPGFAQDTRHPAVCVSREDARAYTEWLSRETGKRYRLLSEAEWEYAARAGMTTPYWWGTSGNMGCDAANMADATARERYPASTGAASCRDGYVHTAPVGSFRANTFGLHDMAGNVWEWTEDCWNGSYAGAPSDGSAWISGNCDLRVLRGGSWQTDPSSIRSAGRIRVSAGFRGDALGFRVARTE